MNKQEFLAMSLPYKLECKRKNSVIMPYTSLAYTNEFYADDENPAKECCIPILHPLSDLTKPINGKMPLSMCFEPCSDDRNTLVDLSHGLIDINNIRFKLVLDLVKRHYDVCNLISKGDAIDINTLPENPYK